MTTAPYELLPELGGVQAKINVRGSAVLASPSINRGTAFSQTELYDTIQQVHDAMWRPVYPRIELEGR